MIIRPSLSCIQWLEFVYRMLWHFGCTLWHHHFWNDVASCCVWCNFYFSSFFTVSASGSTPFVHPFPSSLPPAYEVRREVMFSQVCVSPTLGGGTPSQVQVGGTPSSRWGGGTPFKVQVGGVPHPRSRWGGGTPSSQQGGYPIPGPGRGGTPIQTWDGVLPRLDGVPPVQTWDGVPPVQDWMGYHPSCPNLGWGTPPPTRRQSCIASTCYVAGGMRLAFTQEDFLVGRYFQQHWTFRMKYENLKKQCFIQSCSTFSMQQL